MLNLLTFLTRDCILTAATLQMRGDMQSWHCEPNFSQRQLKAAHDKSTISVQSMFAHLGSAVDMKPQGCVAPSLSCVLGPLKAAIVDVDHTSRLFRRRNHRE